MAYSYSNPVMYGPNNQMQMGYGYDVMNQPVQKPSAVPPTVAGAVVGGGVASIIGARKNPYISSNGAATDTFTKKVYAKYVDKVGGAEKNIYTQTKEVMKKISKTKSAADLKVLIDANKEAVQQALGGNYDDIVNNLADNNLNQNKDTIKKALEAQENNSMQKVKNWILQAWDGSKKKFEKPTTMSDDVFNSITNAKGGMKFKTAMKYGGIGALITGLAAFVAHKIILAKKAESAMSTQQ